MLISVIHYWLWHWNLNLRSNLNKPGLSEKVKKLASLQKPLTDLLGLVTHKTIYLKIQLRWSQEEDFFNMVDLQLNLHTVICGYSDTFLTGLNYSRT